MCLYTEGRGFDRRREEMRVTEKILTLLLLLLD